MHYKTISNSKLNMYNKIADVISRKQWESFRRIAPHADKDPRLIPEPFQKLLRSRSSTCSICVGQHTKHIQAIEANRRSQCLTSSWPPTDVHLNMFIAYLSLIGFKHSTANTYIFAITCSYYCKLYHNSDITKIVIVHKLLQGMKRSNPSTDTKLPFNLDIFNILLPKL